MKRYDRRGRNNRKRFNPFSFEEQWKAYWLVVPLMVVLVTIVSIIENWEKIINFIF